MLEIEKQIKNNMEKIKELEEENKRLEVILQNQCLHTNTEENKYLDYDSYDYEIKCKDCGKVLFYGNSFQLKTFKEKNRK